MVDIRVIIFLAVLWITVAILALAIIPVQSILHEQLSIAAATTGGSADIDPQLLTIRNLMLQAIGIILLGLIPATAIIIIIGKDRPPSYPQRGTIGLEREGPYG